MTKRSLLASVLACSLVATGACSSSEPSSGNPPVTPDRTSALCPKKDLKIFFSPVMYSAHDGVHTFKVPAVVSNIDPTVITWSTSDTSMIDFEQDAALGGVIIAVHKPGEAVIAANGEGKCGASLLKVTAATAEEWNIGSMRYNNGVKFVGDVPGGGRGGGGRGQQDAGPIMTEVACTNCHGDTATMGPYKTVAHTPMQTGGFSDDELIGIFTRGVIPAGGYFDDSFVSYDRWRAFHQWQMSPTEAKGVVVYLRSLTPQSQTGKRGDFGMMGNDGGAGTGREAGVNPPPPPPPVADAAAATD
jgi:hypothetical protein